MPRPAPGKPLFGAVPVSPGTAGAGAWEAVARCAPAGSVSAAPTREHPVVVGGRVLRWWSPVPLTFRDQPASMRGTR